MKKTAERFAFGGEFFCRFGKSYATSNTSASTSMHSRPSGHNEKIGGLSFGNSEIMTTIILDPKNLCPISSLSVFNSTALCC
jgi:hypothetical protein